MELSTFGQGHINYKVIKIFKKDFWKALNSASIYYYSLLV